MDNTRAARNAFLYLVSLVYMFAFASWFLQIPGLYGNNGLLPVRNVLVNDKNKPAETLFAEKPTLLWFFFFYGFSHQVALEVLCLLGVTLSFFCLVFRSVRCMPVFGALWFLYFSLFQVGQTFSWFQWDTLLLESGFLTILVSPITRSHRNDAQHRLPFLLVRWLLFRLMFASGVVKLTSMCPTWWKLTALDYHFETQCIPTPLSWWAHQIPKWMLKLGVVGTYVIEIALPFLFFAPVRKLRLMGAYGQVLLMITIILSGNYNFFNLLTIALCFSAVDDEHIRYVTGSGGKEKRTAARSPSRNVQRLASRSGTLLVSSLYTYFTIKLFGLKLYEKRQPIYSKIEFTSEVFTKWTDDAVTVGIWSASIWFIYESLMTLYLCMKNKHVLRKGWNTLKCCVMLGMCIYLFVISVVPLNTVTSTDRLWPMVRKWHAAAENFQITHSYGLFRRMTGVGGRPEVIVEGSFSDSGPWQEIPFRYKPGNTSGALSWVAPHQPRLDWQMWFAALGQYQHNVWFVNLANKILIGETDVLRLLDWDNYPFKERPPDYVRADLYHYHFTRLRSDGGIPKGIWTRKYARSYLPVLQKGDKQLQDFLKYHGISTASRRKRHRNGRIGDSVEFLRNKLSTFSHPAVLWALFLTASLLSATKKYFAR